MRARETRYIIAIWKKSAKIWTHFLWFFFLLLVFCLFETLWWWKNIIEQSKVILIRHLVRKGKGCIFLVFFSLNRNKLERLEMRRSIRLSFWLEAQRDHVMLSIFCEGSGGYKRRIHRFISLSSCCFSALFLWIKKKMTSNLISSFLNFPQPITKNMLGN